MSSLNVAKKVQKQLMRTMDDSLTKTLLEKSHLTKIQLETFLIDVLTEEISETNITYEDKAVMRLSRQKTSRGSFNRTLNQARKNVIRSIYTLLLLGYLKIIEMPNFNDFVEISNELESYRNAYLELLTEPQTSKNTHEKSKIIIMMREDLKSNLDSLFRLTKFNKEL